MNIIKVGETKTIHMTHNASVVSTVVFTSSNPEIVSITTDGAMTGVSVGVANIHALDTATGITESRNVVVKAAVATTYDIIFDAIVALVATLSSFTILSGGAPTTDGTVITGDSSTTQFSYPVNMTVDPNTDIIYVISQNADQQKIIAIDPTTGASSVAFTHPNDGEAVVAIACAGDGYMYYVASTLSVYQLNISEQNAILIGVTLSGSPSDMAIYQNILYIPINSTGGQIFTIDTGNSYATNSFYAGSEVVRLAIHASQIYYASGNSSVRKIGIDSTGDTEIALNSASGGLDVDTNGNIFISYTVDNTNNGYGMIDPNGTFTEIATITADNNYDAAIKLVGSNLVILQRTAAFVGLKKASITF